MAKTEPFSMRLDAKLKQDLQKLADAERRSLSNFIEMKLYEMVEAHMKRKK